MNLSRSRRRSWPSRLLALDGRCKFGDGAADGYVRGEGCGIVVLKTLSAACAAHDPILALIRSTAVNQDGRSSGLTVPNGPAQAALIRQALAQAGVEPHENGCVEAHGTGTALATRSSCKRSVRSWQGRATPLRVGSIKTNSATRSRRGIAASSSWSWPCAAA